MHDDRFINIYDKYIKIAQIVFFISFMGQNAANIKILTIITAISLETIFVLTAVKNIKQKRWPEAALFSVFAVCYIVLNFFKQ